MPEYIDKSKAYKHFSKRVYELISEVSGAITAKDDEHWNKANGKMQEALHSKFYIMDTHPENVKEIVYAHWILEREPDGKPYCYHCSRCDADFHNTGIKCASKYCPDCGATMNEEIEDNA